MGSDRDLSQPLLLVPNLDRNPIEIAIHERHRDNK